jgi:hypothetical protein
MFGVGLPALAQPTYYALAIISICSFGYKSDFKKYGAIEPKEQLSKSVLLLFSEL